MKITKMIIAMSIMVMIFVGCSSNVVEREGEPDIVSIAETDLLMNNAMQKAKDNIDILITELSSDSSKHITLKVRFEEGKALSICG